MKQYFILTLLLSMSLHGFSQQECATDKNTGCKYYTSNAERRSIEWTGDCVDGFVSGQGELKVFQDGELVYTCVGGMKNGNPHGDCVMEYAAGHKFVGKYNEGDKEGFGRFDYAGGSYYEGNYAANKQNGEGVYVWANGQKYDGEWRNGKYHGAGTFTWSSGSTMKTNWENGIPGGQSELHMANGDSYVGNIKGVSDKNGWTFSLEGKGVFTWSNHDQYTGDWKDGRRHGKGEFLEYYETFGEEEKFKLYKTYTGDWQNDNKHGYGEEINHTSSMNSVYKGNWENGYKSGYGVEVAHGGYSTYDGGWGYGMYKGQGTLTWGSHQFTGTWNGVTKQGFGTYTDPDGNVLEGEWVDNVYQQALMQNVFTDERDGRQYDIVTIGYQTWFAENLAFVPDSVEIFRHPENDDAIAYDWETARTVCPSGWHLPTKTEAEVLIVLSDEVYAAKNLKSTTDWLDDGNGANVHGFNALPYSMIEFENKSVELKLYGSQTSFWIVDSSEGQNKPNTWFIGKADFDSMINELTGKYNFVRCIKD